MVNALDILRERGYVGQTVYEEDLYKVLGSEKVPFYVGFDPTADSLHIGHYIPIMAMAHMQKCGHKPIVLVGGGTGMIGDPSGRSDLRSMLTKEQVEHNVAGIKKQMERFLSFDGENAAVIVNNADWLLGLNYIDFLRDVGVYFSVNKMLTAECFKIRYEKGLTFLEFNYMLMQSYDFLHLNREYGCKLELGGDDQWSNILGGVDLVRRVQEQQVYGMTFTLLTTKEGKKMGKTEKGALWLDPDKTSPYDFYQYWRNVADDDVINCMKLITFVPIEEIEEMEHLEGHELNPVKERLAYEVTSMVHGEEEAKKAQAAAKSLFVKGSDDANMPSTTLAEEDLTNDEIGVLTLLVKTKLAPSNAEARRLVQGGGVSIDDKKVDDPKQTISADTLRTGIVIKKGKKIFHKATLA